jgi:hypothetical protein
VTDLLRAPPLLQTGLHVLTQHRVLRELALPRPRPAGLGLPLRNVRSVTPVPGSVFRCSSLLIVPGERLSSAAIDRIDRPSLCRSAIRIRSSTDRKRAEIAVAGARTVMGE